MPAPVRSRSSLTASAVIAMDVVLLCRSRAQCARFRVLRRRRARARRGGSGRRRDGVRPGRGSVRRRLRRGLGLGNVRGCGGGSTGRPTGQQVVVLELGVEGQRAAGRQLGDEVRRGRSSNSGSSMAWGSAASGSAVARRRPLLGALDRRVGDELAEQPDRADRVVVGRDDVVELVRIAVRVADADDRDLELARLGDRDALAMRVDDEDRAGQALHLADAAERGLELLELLGQQRGFLLRAALEVAGLLARLELLEPADALLDGDEVGEHAAQPALVDVGLAGALASCIDRLLRLLLGADEQHAARRGRRSRGRTRARRRGA